MVVIGIEKFLFFWYNIYRNKNYKGDNYMSILAGIMISIACVVYLSVGGAAGALLFATGLLGILFY